MTAMKHFTLLLGACGLLACNLPSDGGSAVERDYGFIFLDATLSNGSYLMNPTAFFYRTSLGVRLPPGGAPPNRCVREPVSPDPPVTGVYPTISAGPSIAVTLNGTPVSLAQLLNPSMLTYGIQSGELVPTVPGETVSIEIPGEAGRFPAWTLMAPTAEAFAVTPIPTYEEPAPVELQWTPAESPGSRMVVTMRYSAGGIFEEIYCELIDDGSHELAADWMDGWRTASPGKQAVFTRQRITADQQGDALLFVVSELNVSGL